MISLSDEELLFHLLPASFCVAGLDQFHADTSGLHIDVSLQIPQGSQYGSHGSPLHTHVSSPIIGYRTKVELDLSQFQLGADGGVPCSLEKLGIIPTRSPNRWKFGSLTSLRLKTHYPPPSPSASQPVVVRGVVSGYPAAAATQLKPGEREFGYWNSGGGGACLFINRINL